MRFKLGTSTRCQIIPKPTNPKKRINSTDNFCEFYLTSSVPHCETLTSQTVRFYPPRCPTVQVAVASVILCKQNLELWPPTNSPTPTTQAALCIFSHHPFPVSDKAQTQTGAQRQRADWNKQDNSIC